MKNQFRKKDQTAPIIVMAIGAVIAGALAWLYLTESGHKSRKAIKHKLKDEAKDLASGIISKKTGISKKTVKKAADQISR